MVEVFSDSYKNIINRIILGKRLHRTIPCTCELLNTNSVIQCDFYLLHKSFHIALPGIDVFRLRTSITYLNLLFQFHIQFFIARAEDLTSKIVCYFVNSQLCCTHMQYTFITCVFVMKLWFHNFCFTQRYLVNTQESLVFACMLNSKLLREIWNRSREPKNNSDNPKFYRLVETRFFFALYIL